MTINNSKTIIGYKLLQLFITIFFIALFSLLYTTSLIPTPLLGLDRGQIGISLLVLYILFMVYHFGLNLNYIFYSDDGMKIILRYYSIKIYAKKHQSVEISKKDFHHYEIRRGFLYLRPELVLYIQMKKGVGKYPPVSIAALKPRQRRALAESLDRYVKPGR